MAEREDDTDERAERAGDLREALGSAQTLAAAPDDAAVAMAPTLEGPSLSTGRAGDSLPALGLGAGPRYESTSDQDEPIELGRGGIGRVSLVRDRRLGREVARKELLERAERGGSGAQSVSAAVRFVREARVTGQLEHPAIVPVHELGESDDGTLYYTMKVVRGRTLREVLDGASDLAGRLAFVDAISDVCQGVAYAHAHGVVHRDLKPDNVMLGEFGETVVLDWGLAKAHGDEEDLGAGRIARSLSELGAGHTLDGSVMGTPAFMSPEQARGELDAIDARSDVYSLGAMLFTLLTGQAPRTGKVLEVLEQARAGVLPRVRELEREAPADLAAIADKALSADPAERYADAAEMAHEIDAWRDGRQVGAYAYSGRELLVRLVQRHKLASSVLALALLGAVAAGLAVYRSYLVAEQQREVAVHAQARAERNASAAHGALAAAYLERAERSLLGGDPGASAIFASAALLHDPQNPSSPHHDERAAGGDDSVALAYSYLFAAQAARRYRFVRLLSVPDPSILEGEGGDPDTVGYAALALSPDGRTLAAASALGHVVLFDVESDGPPRVEHQSDDLLRDVDFSPDGEQVAVVGWNDATWIRELADWSRVASAGEVGPAATARFMSDGRHLALGQTGGRLLLVPLTAEVAPRVGGVVTAGLVWRLEPAPAGPQVAVADLSGNLLVWDSESGEIVAGAAMTSPALALAYRPDGARVAAASTDDRIWLLDVPSSEPARSVRVERGVFSLQYSGDGAQLVTGGRRGEVHVRDAETGRPRATLHTPRQASRLIAADPELEHIASVGSHLTGRLWRAEPNESFTRRGGFDVSLTHIAVSPDGRSVLVCANTPAIFVVTEGPRGQLDGPLLRLPLGLASGALPMQVAWHPSGERFAFADESGRVGLARPGEPETVEWVIEQGVFDSETFWPLAFSADGQTLYLRTGRGSAGHYTLATRELVMADVDHPQVLNALAVSADGRFLAAGGGAGPVLVTPLEGGPPVQLEGHAGLVSGLDFSPDGSLLASAGIDAVVRLWDTESWELVGQLRGHLEWVNRLEFSPDGRRLVTASDDQSVRVWDVATRRLEHVYFTEELGLVARFSPTGDAVYYNDGLELTRAALRSPSQERDPRVLLERAEEFIGMRLSERALVPIETLPVRAAQRSR